MSSRWASVAERTATAILLIIVVATPLVISRNGDDAFRLPKQLFFQVLTLLGAGIVFVLVLYNDRVRERLLARSRVLIILSAAVAWCTLATIFSKKPAVSIHAPFTLFCYGLFTVALLALPRLDHGWALGAIIVPAVTTSLYGLAQAFRFPTPLIEHDPAGTRNQVIALLGNPNYVATYLVLPVVAVLAAILTWRKHRLWLVPILALLLACVGATLTLTAFVALGVGFGALAITAPTRTGRLTIVLIVLAATASATIYAPVRTRVVATILAISQGQHDRASSFRTPAFAAAIRMFVERPFIGAGPGVFAADYMSYRLAVEEDHPTWESGDNENFAEVHNDHLQILAETGIPGYLLFLTFSTYVAAISFRRRPTGADDHAEFARVFAFPAVASFMVLGLAQFPMLLAASASTALFLSATSLIWIEERS